MKITVEQLQSTLAALNSERETGGPMPCKDGEVHRAIQEWARHDDFLTWIMGVAEQLEGDPAPQQIASGVAMGFILADRIHRAAKLEELAK